MPKHIALIVTLIILTFYSSQSIFLKPSWYGRQDVPINSEEIRARCISLRAFLEPQVFHSRDVSDRYEAGTNATWIKNGAIFTGEENGTVITYGDVLLDKGIIKAVGKVPGWMLDKIENLTTVDARGAWITPGLGKHSHEHTIFPDPRPQSISIHTLVF